MCSECFNLNGGYFYERRGRGNVLNFECIDMHKDDTSEALQIIGHWVLFMAETIDEDNKNNLLVHLTNALSTFYNTKSSLVVANYPSLLFVKMTLKLWHIDIIKIMN